MPRQTIEMGGMRFGRWVVVDCVPTTSGQKKWNCVCDCGNSGVVNGHSLRAGQSQSCGCLSEELSKRRSSKGRAITHGESYSAEYRAHNHMIRRVYKPCKERDARNYRDRGIVVCDRWRHGDAKKSGFECFLSDMGRKPTPAHSLDRIDNDGNYEPSNCRWATPKEQSLNQRKTLFVEYRGGTYTLQDAANSFASISYSGVYQRIRSGWTVADAIDTPSVGNKK